MYEDGQRHWLEGEWVDTHNRLGAGSVFSAAVASNLAKNKNVYSAVRRAKDFMTDCLRAGLDLGQGEGPVGTVIEDRYRN